MNDLLQELDELARTPVLLVASDFDGTLSPIAADPSLARPNREAVVALHALAGMPQTHVAVISGRALRDLAALSGLSDEIHLVGSHGSEFDPDFARRLDPKLIELREQMRDQLLTIVGDGSGFLIEVKPASVAFHYRLASEQDAQRRLKAVLEGPARMTGVHVKHGKKVVELSVVPTDKGRALAAIRHRVGATAALFLGDDRSDEDAFATLRGPDLGVKIGDGATAAKFQVLDTDEATRLLIMIAELRERWLKGSTAVAIERHAMLSDQRTVALVAPDARITWYCAPRIDSPALFAELLGGPAAGYFALGPADGSPPKRQDYAGSTFLLRTDWADFAVTDFLDCSGGRPYQRAGRADLIRVLEGHGPVRIDFAPRLDFGRHATRLRAVAEGLIVEGSLEPIVLRAPGVRWDLIDEGAHQRAQAQLSLSGQTLILELRYGVSSTQDLIVSPEQRIAQTTRFWEVWAGQLRLPPLCPDLVRRSALVLKALCYGPTGAIAAAATTSLPEHLGGVRNWDYRYCWLRDAALAATALCKLGSTGVGTRLVDWLLGVLDREQSPAWFRPVYTVTGGHLGPEADLRQLCGYRGSRPVRVGNAASQQLQLDVFGPIMELVHELARHGVALSTEHWRLTRAIVEAVEQRWEEPDHGIWEIRLQQRHYLHSKVMCWMAVDRAIRVAQIFSGEHPPAWESLRDRIAAQALNKGWNQTIQAFSGMYDETAIDAASLHVGLSGMLPPHDPRVLKTVEVVERTLRRGPVVYRYLYEDGLPGREGGFHLCTAWLIEALAISGQRQRALDLFQQVVALFGPTGLAPEEYCPKSRLSLGNHPQAYSHIGLINAAFALSDQRE